MKTVFKMLVPFVLQHFHTSSSFLFSSSSSYSLVTQALLKALFPKKAHVFVYMLSLLQFQCTQFFRLFNFSSPITISFLSILSPSTFPNFILPPKYSAFILFRKGQTPHVYQSAMDSNLRHTLYQLGQMRQISRRRRSPEAVTESDSIFCLCQKFHKNTKL